MELKEAIEKLKVLGKQAHHKSYVSVDGTWFSVGIGKDEKEAIDTVLQALENIAFKTRLAEGDLEILEKYSINHWNDNFAYVEEAVAVKNLRNRINDIQELLKGE